ncbi:MAG: CRISPR-associated protein Cas4 [Ignavibacterium sp.]|nr:CRISPR-associated protein Cas4 [Ignavibacterium sp.]
MKITGTHINYYFHCKRHLWFYSQNIQMEHTSNLVAIGKFISENTYEREKHELHFEEDDFEYIIDFFDKRRNIIHEIKKTDKMEEVHKWQVKFYIYRLKNLGFQNIKGIIDYPKLRKTIQVELTQQDEKEIEKAIEEIKKIISNVKPPKVINEPFCKKCSYYELCYV